MGKTYEGMEFNRKKAIQNGNRAMAAAAGNAEFKCPGWLWGARLCIEDYPGEVFLVEDVRDWAYRNGLHIPPTERAWGQPIKDAKNDGTIVKTGRFLISQNVKTHGMPVREWRKGYMSLRDVMDSIAYKEYYREVDGYDPY